MRKEVIIAILLGGILGLAIAFGVWRANLALQPIDRAQNFLQNSSPTPTPSANSLIITDPEDNTITSSESATIKGKADAGSSIILTTATNSVSTVADSSGNWNAIIKLDSGANKILATEINNNGEQSSVDLTIIYSTEFKQQ